MTRVETEDMTAGDQKLSVTDVLLLTRQNHCGLKKKTRGKGAQGKNGGPHGSTEKLVFSESNT